MICANCGLVLEERCIIYKVNFQENAYEGVFVVGTYISSDSQGVKALINNYREGDGNSREVTMKRAREKIKYQWTLQYPKWDNCRQLHCPSEFQRLCFRFARPNEGYDPSNVLLDVEGRKKFSWKSHPTLTIHLCYNFTYQCQFMAVPAALFLLVSWSLTWRNPFKNNNKIFGNCTYYICSVTSHGVHF